jgi:hypothetical protein
LLERGIDQRSRFYYGTYPGAMIYSDRFSLLFTQEGLNIVRPLMVGGATSMYCGCAARRVRSAVNWLSAANRFASVHRGCQARCAAVPLR